MKALRSTGVVLLIFYLAVSVFIAGCGGSSISSNSESESKPKLGSITGKIVLPSATAESEANVTATVTLQGTGGSVQTEADGKFTMSNLPIGTYTLVAQTSGWARGVYASVKSGKTTSLGDIELKPSARIVGRVTESAYGEPIEGAIVAAELVTGAGIPPAWTTTTDADGIYIIDDLPPGHYTVDVTKNGYKGLSEQLQNVVGDAASNQMLAILSTTGPGKITGTVCLKAADGSSRPMEGVEVALYRSSGSTATVDVGITNNFDHNAFPSSSEWNHTRTGADGSFELEGIPLNRFMLVVGPLGTVAYVDSVGVTTSRPLECHYKFTPADLGYGISSR